MGNQKSSIDCTTSVAKNDKSKKAKKSHSLNTLLNGNFLVRSNSSQRLRLRFAKKSKKATTLKGTEYTSLNDYNTKMQKSSSFHDNYISIYDDYTVDKKTKSHTLQHGTNDSNLYSKINVNSASQKSAFQLSYNLQPFSKLIFKLGAFTRRSRKCPLKRFDPNEEFYFSQPIQHKLGSHVFNDQSNLYTDMSESICSELSRIKIETEDNYQSLHDQYDYISTHSGATSLEPPPLPPASTQPCRDHAINHIFTCIHPAGLSNHLYYSCSNQSAPRERDIDNSLQLSISSSCTSIQSSVSNEMDKKCVQNSSERILEI